MSGFRNPVRLIVGVTVMYLTLFTLRKTMVLQSEMLEAGHLLGSDGILNVGRDGNSENAKCTPRIHRLLQQLREMQFDDMFRIEPAYNESFGSSTLRTRDGRIQTYARCAVVGPSGSLLSDPNLGSKLDTNYDAFIRFNTAPLSGYEKYVGTRTTLRITNLFNTYWRDVKYEKGDVTGVVTKLSPEHYDQDLEKYEKFRKKRQVANIKVQKDNFFAPTEKFIHLVKRLSADHNGHTRHQITSGFFGIVLSLRICGSVDIYGFDNSATHKLRQQTLQTSTKTSDTIPPYHYYTETSAFSKANDPGAAYKPHDFSTEAEVRCVLLPPCVESLTCVDM